MITKKRRERPFPSTHMDGYPPPRYDPRRLPPHLYEARGGLSLKLNIFGAEGIDPPEPGAPRAPTSRVYRAVAWVNPNPSGEAGTMMAMGLPDPRWQAAECFIPLVHGDGEEEGGWSLHGWSLHVEVIRCGDWRDPGPSSGEVVVGRTRIALPGEVGSARSGRFGLVREDGRGGLRPEGHVMVAMEVLGRRPMRRKLQVVQERREQHSSTKLEDDAGNGRGFLCSSNSIKFYDS